MGVDVSASMSRNQQVSICVSNYESLVSDVALIDCMCLSFPHKAPRGEINRFNPLCVIQYEATLMTNLRLNAALAIFDCNFDAIAGIQCKSVEAGDVIGSHGYRCLDTEVAPHSVY